MMTESDNDFLKANGLQDPYRVKHLIELTIDAHRLDLTDLTVLTEAASKYFVVTPIIAAMAGARVYAITKDSEYGSAKNIEEYTYCFAKLCGVKDRMKVIFERQKNFVSKANIITNLGFVRPIDRCLIEMMNDKAVIPYMSEAWEFRQGDLDLEACKVKGVPVLATNENAPGLKVFDYCGMLCLKMMFEMGLEAYKSRVLLVSSDKFGKVIKRYLSSIGAEVSLVYDLKTTSIRSKLKNCDALIIADYCSQDVFVGGRDAQIEAKELASINPGLCVIQFSGVNDIGMLDEFDIEYFPKKQLGRSRMGMTLADLGPRPVIELHSAGLKVGEIMARARLEGRSINEIKQVALKHPFSQKLPRVQLLEKR
jgi:hypothetical protein